MTKFPAWVVVIPFIGVLAACGPARPPLPSASSGFFTPADPPASRYVIDVRLDAAAGSLEGREKITLKNAGRIPLTVVAFDWAVGPQSTLEVMAGGRRIFPPEGGDSDSRQRPIVAALPEPLAPGKAIELEAAFGLKADGPWSGSGFSTSSWYPRLWWDGLPHHDSYSVKVDAPAGFAVAASGRLDPRTGRYEAAAARTFGIWLAPGLKAASREVDGVLITSYFTDKGSKAAAVCLETAASAVHFYKEWLGFYPFPFLHIIPGGAGRWGGYPVATGIVAIHGLETYVDGESPLHWQHITSHEVGHEYWGEWVPDGDDPSWVWIAMGIFADTEYMTSRGYDPDRAGKWMGNYINAIPLHYDTMLAAPAGREDAVHFDFNNIVVHSKGPAVAYALDEALGRETFLRTYKRCLRDFAGRRFGWRDLKTVAEAESGQSLDWFFDAWVRSNQYLCYGSEAEDSRPDGAGGFTTEVRLLRLGTMSMPVPVRAEFGDGSTQTGRADRTRAVTALTFKSRAPLRGLVLDPSGRWAKVETPIPPISAPAAAALAFGWEANQAERVYEAVKAETIASPSLWYQLGLGLYGAKRLEEAAECFARADRPEAGSAWRFGALGWRGLLADLRGRRAEALGFYKSALAIAPDRPLRHDQFKITMDKAWAEERLKRPFVPGEQDRVPAHPTAAQLVDFVDALGWEKEGETPLLVYRKAAGLTITDARFWLKLGLLLYDSRADKEGLAAFLKMAEWETSGLMAFTARVWQGHMNDLLRNRPAALECYRAALKLDPGTAMKHSQWGMTIDRAWVEERLRAPFTRK